MTHDQAREGIHVRCDNCEGVDPASCINAGPKREGTPPWEQDGMSERAFNAWQNTSSTLPLRDRLDAVLAAVGPMIAAPAWDEGTLAQARHHTGPNPYREVADR